MKQYRGVNTAEQGKHDGSKHVTNLDNDKYLPHLHTVFSLLRPNNVHSPTLHRMKMPTRCLVGDTGSKAHDGFRPACRWRKRAGQLKVGRVFRLPREYVRRVPEMTCMCMVEAWEEWFSEKRTANGPQTRPRKCGYTTWLPVGVRRPPSHPLPSKQHAVSCQLLYCLYINPILPH